MAGNFAGRAACLHGEAADVPLSLTARLYRYKVTDLFVMGLTMERDKIDDCKPLYRQ
jgi:hypothetical protein